MPVSMLVEFESTLMVGLGVLDVPLESQSLASSFKRTAMRRVQLDGPVEIGNRAIEVAL